MPLASSLSPLTAVLFGSYTVRVEPPTGRRERRRERVRTALLDAAMTLFTERGLHGTRVEDITERADLGKGAFYNYFESKDALIGELLMMGIDRLEQDYLREVGESSEISERVDRLVRLHDRFFEEHPEYVVLFHQARGLLHVERSDTPRLRGIFADYLRRVGDRLLAGDVQVTASGEERANLAALVVGAVSGYRSYRLAAGLRPRIGTIAGALRAGVPAVIHAPELEAEDA